MNTQDHATATEIGYVHMKKTNKYALSLSPASKAIPDRGANSSHGKNAVAIRGFKQCNHVFQLFVLGAWPVVFPISDVCIRFSW